MEQNKQKIQANKEVFYSNKIKDIKLREVFLILSSKNLIKTNRINWNTEVEENVKQEIRESLKDKIKDLNEIFSELRKDGKDLGVLNLKLMILPLKLKVFFSTYDKKDVENLLEKISYIEKELEKMNKK